MKELRCRWMDICMDVYGQSVTHFKSDNVQFDTYDFGTVLNLFKHASNSVVMDGYDLLQAAAQLNQFNSTQRNASEHA